MDSRPTNSILLDTVSSDATTIAEWKEFHSLPAEFTRKRAISEFSLHFQSISDALYVCGVDESVKKRILTYLYNHGRGKWKNLGFSAIQKLFRVNEFQILDGHEVFDGYHLSDFQMAQIYRARRIDIIHPPVSPEAVLTEMKNDYRETNAEKYSDSEVRDLMKGMAFPKNRDSMPLYIRSSKSCFRYPRSVGGFNKSLKSLCIRDPEYLDDGIYSEAKQSHNEFMMAVRASYALIKYRRKKKILPLVFVSSVGERGKTRLPGVPECFVQTLSRQYSYAIRSFLYERFPTFGREKFSGGKQACIYVSGDYKISTAPIPFRILRCIAKTILSGVSSITANKDWGRAIDYMLGPHRVVAHRAARKAVVDKFNDMSRPWWYGKNPHYIKFCYRFGGGDPIVPTTPRDICSGLSYKMERTKYVNPRSYTIKSLCERFDYSSLDLPSVVTSAGVMMCYGIAQPLLFLLNEMAHIEVNRDFRVQYLLIGDDNASKHSSYASVNKLEELKLKTGMLPHTNYKTVVSELGFVLGERIFKEKKKRMHAISYAPVRALFPMKKEPSDYLTLPQVAKNYLQLVVGKYSERVWAFVWRQNKRDYQALAKAGIDLTGGYKPLLPFIRGLTPAPRVHQDMRSYYASHDALSPVVDTTLSLREATELFKKHQVPHTWPALEDDRSRTYRTARITGRECQGYFSAYCRAERPVYTPRPHYVSKAIRRFKQAMEGIVPLDRLVPIVASDEDGFFDLDPIGNYSNKLDMQFGFDDLRIKRLLIIDGNNSCGRLGKLPSSQLPDEASYWLQGTDLTRYDYIVFVFDGLQSPYTWKNFVFLWSNHADGVIIDRAAVASYAAIVTKDKQLIASAQEAQPNLDIIKIATQQRKPMKKAAGNRKPLKGRGGKFARVLKDRDAA